jgi:hypothetical protein
MRLPPIGIASRTLPLRADARRKRHRTGKSHEGQLTINGRSGKQTADVLHVTSAANID